MHTRTHTHAHAHAQEVASLGAEYGEQVREAGAAITQHLEALRPTLKELAQLEYTAQNLFLEMQTRFSAYQ
jgi:hypothetical protein